MNEDLATAKRAGLIFLPLAAIAAVAFFLLFRIQDDAARAVAEAAEARVLDQARLIVLSSLAAGAADLRYLAEEPLLNEWLDDTEDRLARQRIAGDCLAFVAVHPAFDRINLVDVDGKELIRVDWSAGAPQIAEDASLADHVAAPYVAETLKRGRGEVYQSSFELSPDQGAGPGRLSPPSAWRRRSSIAGALSAVLSPSPISASRSSIDCAPSVRTGSASSAC